MVRVRLLGHGLIAVLAHRRLLTYELLHQQILGTFGRIDLNDNFANRAFGVVESQAASLAPRMPLATTVPVRTVRMIVVIADGTLESLALGHAEKKRSDLPEIPSFFVGVPTRTLFTLFFFF